MKINAISKKIVEKHNLKQIDQRSCHKAKMQMLCTMADPKLFLQEIIIFVIFNFVINFLSIDWVL